MTRVKRGSIARKRRTKFSLFTSSFRGAHSKLTRNSSQQRIKASVSSHRDRGRKKRDFRSLWISRINALGLIIGKNKKNFIDRHFTYSNFIYKLYESKLLIDRKIVAQIALLKGNNFFMIADDIIKKKTSPETQLREGGRIKLV